MSYPLIQNPAPLQQLADTVNAIRAARQQRIAFEEERRLNAARDARGQRYLELAEAQQANAIQQQRIRNELLQADLGFRQMDAASRRRHEEFERATVLRERYIAERIPEAIRGQVGGIGDIVDANQRAQANAAIAGAAAPFMGPAGQVFADAAGAVPQYDLAAEVQQAQGRAVEGRQGSVVRAPQIGRSDAGVTFVPGRPTLNAPSGSAAGGGRPPTTQDLLMRAAITGAYQQMESMEQMEAADPESPRVPGVYNTIEEAGNIPMVGGMLRGALEPVAQQALTPNQQAYMAMRREFIHTYASSLPGRRLGPELLKLLEVAFFPRAGQTDPGTLATYRSRRREAADRMYRAAQGEPIDLESVLPPNILAAMNGLDQPGARNATPAAPSASPGGPAINPRFMGGPR